MELRISGFQRGLGIRAAGLLKAMQSAACVALLAFSTAPAHARFEPPVCKNAFTPQQEFQEGQKAAQQVLKTQPVLPDSSLVTQYVQRLGARLAQYAPGEKWPYNFHVTNLAEINAFALPGGAVFVNLGTIQAAETEAQLAGVIAHEISHVALRHSTCNITKEQNRSVLFGLGQLAAGILLPGTAGALAQTGIGFGAQTLFLRYSRDAEKQADLLGADILYDAGYDPRGLPQFFEIIQAKYGAGSAEWLSDHPNPGNRTEYVQAEIDTLPPKTNYVKTSADFKQLKKLVANMHPYTEQQLKNGAWRGGGQGASQPANVVFTPSGDWKQAATAAYTIDYPSNWLLASNPESAAAAATMAPPGGANADNTTYGVVINSSPIQPGTSLANATNQLLDRLIRQNSGQLKVARGVEDISVNKQPSMDAELIGPSALTENGQPLPERDWLVTIPRGDNSLIYIVFIAPDKDFPALRPSYEQMLRSFRLK